MSQEEKEFVDILSAIVSHEMDGLRLFRPTQDQEDALRQIIKTRETLVDAGNRAGKTVLGAVWFASYVRDEPIVTWDGEEIHCRPEHKRGKPLIAWVTGDYLKHIGNVIYRMLLDPHPPKGVFKIIRDEASGAWRAWAPHRYENDWDREGETRWAPPLIPPTAIEGGEPSWIHKNLNQWASFKLKKDKTQVFAYASSAALQQGVPVDCLWNDEDLVTKKYWSEWIMRLPDSRGQILWTTIPRDVCPIYHDICGRAEEQAKEVELGDAKEEDVTTRHISLSFLNSPYIKQEDKDFAIRSLNDRETMVRVYGKASTTLIAIYQDFDEYFHTVEYPEEKLNDAVTKVMRENGWRPPANWTRELILDPGTQKPAVLFGAIPPPELWDHGQPYFVVYDEIYKGRANAYETAREIRLRERGQFFERFIGDGNALRQTPMGFGKTVGQQYAEAFASQQLSCKQTGSMFVYGSNDFQQRSMMVMDAMRPRSCGRPQLRIVRHKCPHLIDQLKRNIRKTDPEGNPLEEPANYQKDDMRVCFHPSVEVLTDKGWKYWPDVTDERLATLNKSNELEFQQPTALISKRHGDLLHFDSKAMDMLVTPDHRMAVYSNGADDDDWHMRMASEVTTTNLVKLSPNRAWSVESDQVTCLNKPFAARNCASEVNTCDWAEFLGWYVAEGSIDKKVKIPGNGYRVQISQRKGWGRREFEALLKRLPWHATPHPDGYIFSSKQLWTEVWNSGCGNSCYTKRAPEWVKWSSQEVIEAFLRGYWFGDGTRSKTRREESCITTSRLLADDIQELLLRLGISSSISSRHPAGWEIEGRTGTCARAYTVKRRWQDRASVVNSRRERLIKEFPYSGPVYCATVDNGTLIVRRNGKAMVAGNCLEYWISRYPRYQAPPHADPSQAPGMAHYESYKKWMLEFAPKTKQDGSIPLGVTADF